MPRTDVPPPGQGKRSKRKAWRNNADQTIAIYNLTAEETPEVIDTEEAASESQVLPYWDDTPELQPQSQSPSHTGTYTEEEAQELVEKAYQEGWQQGMEEGYKLGRDKGIKEYKVQEEEEAKKTENQANQTTTERQDACNTPSIVTSPNTTPQMHSATPGTCTITKMTHIAPTPPISTTTPPKDLKQLPAASRNATSTTPTSFSLEDAQNVENAHSAVYNNPISSNTIQAAQLHPRNTSNDVSVPFIIYNDPQIVPSSNQSNSEKYHPLDILISEYTKLDTQKDESTVFLVNSDAQVFAPAPRKSPDAAGAGIIPHMFMPHHHLPPLPSLQPMSPSPYKRQVTVPTTSQTLAAPRNDLEPPKKLTAVHQIMDSDIPALSATPSNIPPPLPPVPDFHYSTASAATPTIIIHAQTVVIGGPTSSHISTQNASNNERTILPKHSTGNSEEKYSVPASPSTTAVTPRDLSVLRSRHRRPFYSLQRRSRRCQSVPVRGLNWDNYLHHRDFSRAFQARGWTSTVH